MYSLFSCKRWTPLSTVELHDCIDLPKPMRKVLTCIRRVIHRGLRLGPMQTLATWIAAVAVTPVGAAEGVLPALIPSAQVVPAACPASHTASVHALLVGVTDYSGGGLGRLSGPGNDVSLFGQALRNSGVPGEKVVNLVGHVTQSQFVQALQTLALRARCSDTLVIAYSGHAGMLAGRLPSMVFSDFEGVDDARRGGRGALDGQALIGLFDWLRDRGVNVAFVADTFHAPGFSGHAGPVARGEDAWTWQPWSSKLASPQEAMPERGAFYGVFAPAAASEGRLPPGDVNGKVFGLWTYAVANALLSEGGQGTFRKLASTAQAIFETSSGQSLESMRKQGTGPVFESTHPDRPMLALGAPNSRRDVPLMRGREDRSIDITSPPLQRGATAVSRSTLSIQGRVRGDPLPKSVTANQSVARLNPDGTFSLDLPIQKGENRIAVVAWWSEVDFLPKAFTVMANDAGVLTPPGKRYAVVIANQRYQDGGYDALATPHADAQALADLLTSRYGFITTLPRGADAPASPLVLKDSTRAEMLGALSSLRRTLQPEDSLLVFYAGHGVYERETGQAYWLPVDANRDEPHTWLSAHDIQTSIARLNVRHVLVIADSCFSGAFVQRGEANTDSGADRQALLGNLMLRSSRRFISSGANEPVSDGGGAGHSVFARALIDALRAEAKPFTANELFTRHLVSNVGSRSKQLPQLFAMKEGHDGGELVFFPSPSIGSDRPKP